MKESTGIYKNFVNPVKLNKTNFSIEKSIFLICNFSVAIKSNSRTEFL